MLQARQLPILSQPLAGLLRRPYEAPSLQVQLSRMKERHLYRVSTRLTGMAMMKENRRV